MSWVTWGTFYIKCCLKQSLEFSAVNSNATKLIKNLAAAKPYLAKAVLKLLYIGYPKNRHPYFRIV